MAAQTQIAFEPVHQLRDRMTKGEESAKLWGDAGVTWG
jgi:hypothetical protein